MEQRSISGSFHALTDEGRRYIRIRLAIFKLAVTEKASRITSFLMLGVIFLLFFFFFILFVSLAFLFWYKDHAGPAWAGSLIVAGFYLLMGIIAYLLRHRLFVNPLVSVISRIIMEEDDDEEV